MKLTGAIFFGLTALVAYVQASPAPPSETPTTGEFTRAPGTVVDTSKIHGKMSVKTFKRNPPADNEVVTLDLSTISEPIQPGDPNHAILPSHVPAIRGRSHAGINCPSYAPWICDGVSCINIFTHMCCKGGVICKDPDVCVRDALGNPACHRN
ncbi:hypothetical protein MGYG_06371 [Nannizzia gypsea CBS 118893]|uniref:Uncharacterized protein n=1 Tax=Arthroderma gypseum (strain ATCC MYA-4604 / CBS 118893) TaxID=535722 RepID=E4UZ42_ARTGP|nr:hypothetical protein MGYG_06371 [Nannizzia gypsea CBS 118893]EFR03372.1 hypothetical protein MGYG_06371 [Nannizzia gypsea CBS 118893]